MIFKGTIIITDPCYFKISSEDWGEGKTLDYTKYKINGFSSYLWTSSGGDGSWKVYQTERIFDRSELLEAIDISLECMKNEDDKIEEVLKNKYIGRFSADSGTIGVFYLEDILKYNPKFKVDFKTSTMIRDFSGNIEIVSIYHPGYAPCTQVIGEGNKSFFTL